MAASDVRRKSNAAVKRYSDSGPKGYAGSISLIQLGRRRRGEAKKDAHKETDLRLKAGLQGAGSAMLGPDEPAER